MSAISLKSITGITSITTPAGVDNQLTLHTNNTTERVKIDVAGNVHINNHLAVAGVSTFTGDIDVDGHTNLDNVSVAGVTTFSNNVKFDGATAGRDVTFIRSSNTLEFASNAILELGNGGSGDCRLFNNGTDTRIINGNGTLKFESDTHEFRDKDNTTSYLTITSDGKLLVGATAATNGSIAEFSKSVAGGGAGCHITVENTSTNSVNNTAGIHLKTDTGTAKFFKYRAAQTFIQSAAGGASELILQASGAHPMRLYAGDAEKVRIEDTGEVHFYGNQTSAPEGDFGFRWDRNSSVDFCIKNTNNTSVNAGARIKLIANIGNIAMHYVNNGGFYLNNSASGYLHYYTGGTSRLYIDTSGNITINNAGTIGTSNGGVGKRLGIKSNANNVIIGETESASNFGLILESRVSGRSGDARSSQIGLGNGVIDFYTANAGAGVTKKMEITANGDVRIGGGTASTFGSGTTVLSTYNTSTYTANLVASGTHILQMIASQTHGATSIGTRSNHNLNLCANDSTKMTITTGGVIETVSKTITGGTSLAIQNFAVKGVWSGAPSIGKSIELISGYDSSVKMAAIGYNLTDTSTGSTYGGDLTFHTQPLYSSPQTPIPESMRISSSGYVTKPKHPSFCARYQSGDGYVSTNIFRLTGINNDNFTWNTGGHYSTSTGKFTAPVAGVYFFEGQAMTTGHSNGDNIQDMMELRTNNGLVTYCRQRRTYFRSDADANGYYVNGTSGQVNLAVGDTVWFQRRSGLGYSYGNSHYTYFTGWLIG